MENVVCFLIGVILFWVWIKMLYWGCEAREQQEKETKNSEQWKKLDRRGIFCDFSLLVSFLASTILLGRGAFGFLFPSLSGGQAGFLGTLAVVGIYVFLWCWANTDEEKNLIDSKVDSKKFEKESGKDDGIKYLTF
ncbi:hypothetical protein FACS189428_7560 [Clostridia bacterium]|nr:hypothetical protein FACS189428_7560 [Clostridia bacterium]